MKIFKFTLIGAFVAFGALACNSVEDIMEEPSDKATDTESGSGGGDPENCAYNDKVYSIGESFVSVDGSITCSCELGGNVVCTEKGCIPEVFCEHNGKQYKPDETIPVENCGEVCSCTAAGLIQCIFVDTYCPSPCEVHGKIYQPGETFMDDCNTCTCFDGENVGCTEMGCGTDPGFDPAICPDAPLCTENGIDHFSCPEGTDGLCITVLACDDKAPRCFASEQAACASSCVGSGCEFNDTDPPQLYCVLD